VSTLESIARAPSALPRGPRAVAVVGIVLGILAFWLSLPPLAARTVIWALLLGLLAVAAGVWAFTRGERKAGGGAAVVGAIGLVVVARNFPNRG